ncbi:choice-of-anchor J domain-containing protein [Hanstruepera ponticola]|uniref:choice-of-anchor J domain-containing protein n=1 Tax=Hanstruepera ponticola TaxID=2042995 RepID=UPI001780AF4B|nr:choice-of-anchor J domain-containing protein [Hanstruepera ponticola]
MKNKLPKTVAILPFLFLRARSKNKSFVFVFCLSLFLMVSGKGFAQLNESFDSGIPGAWTLFGNGVGTFDWTTTSDGYLGTNGVSLNPSDDNIGDGNTAQYFLVTPQIAVPENGEIQFYTKQANEADNGAQYEIRISTAAQPDINGFNIPIQSYTESNLNVGSQTSYEKKVVEIPESIPTGLNIYVAFVVINTQNGATPTGDEWFVDEVAILEGCTEVLDEDVTIDQITVNSAEITWDHPTATNFEIQILPTGGVPADSGIPVVGTSYSLMNLDAQTEYDIYISAICDNDTQSGWSGPYTFETLKFGLSCDFPIELTDLSSAPYVLTDNLANWVNPDEVYSTEGTNCNTVGSTTANYLNGDKVFLSYTPTEDGLISLSITTFVGGGENCFNNRSSLFVYEGCSNVGINCIAGTNTTNSFDPRSINNLLVQAGQAYIIVVSSQLSSTAGICFELEISSPTCAPPSDFEYNNLTSDSVLFSWDNIGGFADSWEYAVVPTGSGEPTGAGTTTNTNSGTLINSGLTPATTYDLYVRSVCGGTPGIWSNPSTFMTQCTTFDTPYSTDFANATNENPEPCWTTIDANKDGITWAFIGGYATVQTESSQNENYDIYASPRVNFDGTPKRIRYKHRATQGVSTYTVKLSTTGVGYDDFTTTVLPETTINNTSFQEVIVDLPEDITGEVNIAWIVEPNASEDALRLSIDDVFIEDKPTCPDPLNPFVLQITTNSAWLFWTAGDAETQWEVAIQDEGSGVPTGSGLLVDSNFPYMATGLDSGNRYEFYVRAYCAADDQSEWVGPVAFTTLCESYDTPFYESFDDADPDTQKFCWKITDANNDGTTWSINENNALIQTAPFSPPSSFNEYLISPAINLDGTTKELKYKYRAEFSFFTGPPRFGLEVLMSTTNTSPGSFTVIEPLEVFTNTGYIEKSIILEGTGTIYIAFRVPPQFTGGWSVLNLDDVSITDAPACPNPSDLTVDTVFTDGAELSWTEGFQETNWNIVVQPAGSGVPTGTGETVTATNFSATGLTPDTEYEFYVMADCGAEGSEWVGPITFRTLCSPFSTPFVETFNYDSETEDCWVIVNDNGDLETWELDSGAFPYEGDQAAAMFTGTNGRNEDWLISPTITITDNQRLRYYYRVNDSFFTEDLEVLLSTNGTGLDQFTTVLYDSDDDPILLNNVEYRVKIINFPDGITGDVNIAFHVPFFPSTGPYRGQTLVIDNVNIEDIPECPAPTNIFIDNVTDTAFQVTWDANGSETEWEISVQPSGTPAPVGDTDPSYLYNADTNPFTVTGLTASTAYDIYVRAVCDGDIGEWTGPVEALTRCSFENLCQYTFVLNSDSDISGELEITQNNQEVQALPFAGNQGDEFPLFLCSGVEFTVFFNTLGSNANQFANYSFEIRNDQGTTIYTSPTGLIPRRTVYEGTAICGTISCPQPTDLSISATNVMSWTAGGSETEWEVAIQPIENGTIPQSGTIVSTNSYTPTATDFSDPFAVTYEYFVRAVCGTDDESYWSGPFEFIRNDDVTTAITLPINTDEVCHISATEASFIGATASSETMSCNGVNGGDIWFEFTAESTAHVLEINSFSGDLRESNGDLPYHNLIMTLYRDNAGTLEEITCSYDNLLLAMYSSELVIGDNYKLRITLDSNESDAYRFNVCVKTPEDACTFNLAVNGSFEEPNLDRLSGITTIKDVKTMPGWRCNLDSSDSIFIWESLNAPGLAPYEGGQFVQLLSDQGTTIDQNDNINVKGYYTDFDTSEITLFDYSFAHYARFDGNAVELLAGPPGGPYTQVTLHLGDAVWQVVSGEYVVPNGQDVTRFIFRANGTDNVGNALDAVSFVANNEIITQPSVIDCTDATLTLEANGTGTWIPNGDNPGAVIIDDANNSSTTVSGFLQPGEYIFTWQTTYCENSVAFTYNGIAEMPTVETPVEYCLNDTAQPLTATPSGSYSLVWYTQAVGGAGSTTAPTPDTSVVGSTAYYVANADTNGCEGPRVEIVVNVNASVTPELTFSYETTCIVDTNNPLPTLNSGFVTGGSFSSATLTVDSDTGEIDITSATAGQHDVVYTYDGDSDTCTLAGTFTATIEFTTAITPTTEFDYGTNPFCQLSMAVISPNLASGFTTGGVFSSGTLIVNSTTGEIDLASATVGNHDITYTIDADAATCLEAGSFTTSIEITASTASITDFTYENDIFCEDSSNVLPILEAGFTTGGVFSAESGLSIDAATGEINISTSSIGNYTIVYEVLDDLNNCIEGNISLFDITVLDTIGVSVEGACNGNDYWLTAIPVSNSFDPDDATYTWMDANNNVVGENSEMFNVTDYANQNGNVSAPIQFSVTVEFGGCSTTTSYTATQLACQETVIPRGISPDGNGKNDTFDLTDYGATNVIIFNRHGREVYKFSGAYTNQWYGQSKDGNDLPDGTYYYSIQKEDGSSVTGWVYINRAH